MPILDAKFTRKEDGTVKLLSNGQIQNALAHFCYRGVGVPPLNFEQWTAKIAK